MASLGFYIRRVSYIITRPTKDKRNKSSRKSSDATLLFGPFFLYDSLELRKYRHEYAKMEKDVE
jgi:hypothetical protein